MKYAVLIAWLAIAMAVAPASAAPGDSASVAFVNASGAPAGKATIVEQDGALVIDGHVQDDVNLRGLHGLHIHAVGQCEPPFDSAGGHFNPDGMQHGHHNVKGPHAGDLSNIDLTTDGHFRVVATGLTLDVVSVLDPDGSAIIIHAGPDDDMTDPSGNSGARLLCGVIEQSN